MLQMDVEQKQNQYMNLMSEKSRIHDQLKLSETATTNQIIAAKVLREITKLSKKYKLPVLDDACESLGAEWGNEKLGAQADIATWSFDGGKTITAGEGGMITTNNKELYLLF